jgi:hypothetical protein
LIFNFAANSSWVHPLSLRRYFRFFPAVDID